MDEQENLKFPVAKAETGMPAQDVAEAEEPTTRQKGSGLGLMSLLGSVFGGGFRSRRSKNRKLSTHAQKLKAEEKKKKAERRLHQGASRKYTMDRWSASSFHCPKCGAKPSQRCTILGDRAMASGGIEIDVLDDHGFHKDRPGVHGGSKRSRMAG